MEGSAFSIINMTKHALLFDLDGTLVDSLPDIHASANYIRGHYGLPSLSQDEVKTMVGDGLHKLLERALELDPEQANSQRFQEALGLYREHHAQQCIKLVQPYPGVRQHLQRWAQAGHPMAVVTNKPTVFASKIIHHLALQEYLPVIIGGDTLPEKKPHPAPLLHAMQQLGSPKQGIMVGDSVSDIRAGKAAGLRTVAVTFGYRNEEVLLRAEADEYWPRFGEPQA